MEWISVKDRLPEVDQECIVYFTNGTESFVTCDAFWNENKFETLRSHRDEVWIYSESDCEVTHWIPLPEPPTQ